MTNGFLVLVAAECVGCGSTGESVNADRLLCGEKQAVCCLSSQPSFTDGGFPGSEPYCLPKDARGANR
jgi:hypothetical protein